MKHSWPLGIAAAASFPLIVFVLLFLLLTAGLFGTFMEIRTAMDAAVSRMTPALISAGGLMRDCEQIRGISIRMSHTDNEFVLRSEMDALRTHFAAADHGIGQLGALGMPVSRLDRFRQQTAAFKESLAHLQEQVRRRLEIQTRRVRLVKSLRALSFTLGEMYDPIVSDPALRRWHHSASQTSALLLALGTDMDVPYGLRLCAEAHGQLEQARQALAEIGTDSDGVEAAVRLRQAQLELCALGEDGMLNAFMQGHASKQALAALALRISALSEAIAATTADLFARSQEKSLAERDALEAQIASASVWLVCFTLFSLLAVAFTHCYLNLKVVAPIIRLNKSMRLQTRGIGSAFPDDGAKEIREMTESTRFFIRENAEREQELLRSRENLERQVLERTAELNRLSRRLLQTQEEERFRLAAELHDDMGATLSVIKFGIERALTMLRLSNGNAAAEPLAEAIGLVKRLAGNLRRMQEWLRPAHIGQGLALSLVGYGDDYQAVHPEITLHIYNEAEDGQISSPIQLVIFRVIQESLNNVAKHSQATRVVVSIAFTDKGLQVFIRDNGMGCTVTAVDEGAGLGFKSMRERVELSGGSLHIESNPGAGLEITAFWLKESL